MDHEFIKKLAQHMVDEHIAGRQLIFNCSLRGGKTLLQKEIINCLDKVGIKYIIREG